MGSLKLISTARRLKSVLLQAGAAFCVYYTIRRQVLDLYLIEHESMEPTLSAGDIVIAVPARSSFWGIYEWVSGRPDPATVHREDIIIARNPTHPREHIVKRVLGLRGDRIPPALRTQHRFVPEGQAWLEGDNEVISRDSRSYGPVPLGLVKGKVVAKLHPFQPL